MKLEDILSSYEKDESNLIEVLNKIQDSEGYISIDNQKIISEYFDIPLTKIYSVITFYSRFTLEPSGKYNISVCMGTACYVKGASNLLDKLQDLLGIKVGELTSDKLFKIVENRCVGACSIAPVVIVNDKVYGNCTTDKLEQIINDLRGMENE